MTERSGHRAKEQCLTTADLTGVRVDGSDAEEQVRKAVNDEEAKADSEAIASGMSEIGKSITSVVLHVCDDPWGQTTSSDPVEDLKRASEAAFMSDQRSQWPLLRCDDCGQRTMEWLPEPNAPFHCYAIADCPGKHWRPDGTPCEGTWRTASEEKP